MFDGAGLLAMPLYQPLHLPFEDVGHHGKVFHLCAVGEQPSLFLPKSECNVANGLGILALRRYPLNEIDFGTFTDIFTMAWTSLPVLFCDFLHSRFQLRTHPGRY